MSSFVGRRREVVGVQQLLDQARLVTVTGVGGVGKTRLALQAAARVGSVPDGVWLVDLATVDEPELVASAVADTLEVADRSAPSVLSAVGAFLADKRLLLVLDNCEHLLDSCAAVATTLLAAAAGVRVLATSRQPLGVAGETVFDLPPLATPDADPLAPGDLSRYESVRLFVERARATLPDFTLTAANRDAVAGVCRHLDGLPLAIELAASRLRVLSVQQILDRLDERFRLLTAGSRTAPARQRTLRDALAWSHELCWPREQAMWARASVFAGFDLPAAEAVCAGDDLPRGEVLDLITGLIDKSVMYRVDGPGDSARYRMLETVREFGHERLVGSRQVDALRRRHRRYFRDLTRRAAAERVSPHEVEWLRRLLRELPNLRLALESGLTEPGAAPEALEIATAAQDLWLGAGRCQEGQRWLTRALAIDTGPSPLRATGLAFAGFLTTLLGDPTAGERMVIEARATADRLGDVAAGAVATLHQASWILLARPADLDRAPALIERALAGARAAGDLRTTTLCHLSAATVLGFLDDPRAVGHAEQVRALGAEHGAAWTEAWGRLMLALTGWRSGEPERTVALVREALPVLRTVHDSWGAGAALAVLAWEATGAGRYRYAARLLGACHSIKRREGTPLTELGSHAEHQARCERDTRRALGDAAYSRAFEEGAHLTLAEAIGYGLGDDGAARPVPGDGVLTPREAEVAELIAEGLTNKEIADRLFVSQRTAESHTDHILAKLGFASRAQVASWATERRGGSYFGEA